MTIVPPKWALKDERCGYCDVGELVFSQCPQCGVVILICGECGTAYEFLDRSRGREVGDGSGTTRCHNCGGPYHREFSPATSQVIQSLGLDSDAYR
jgi:hypothetical protein